MSLEQENFEGLRRLLVLKRYEQPPPGYFNDFSSRVIARIEAGEARESWFQRFLGETPWFQQFWAVLGGRPALAGGFGLAICGLLMAGVVFTEDPSPSTMAVTMPLPDRTIIPVQLAVQPATPVTDRAMTVGFSSTAGVLPQSGPSIFQEFKESQRPLFQRVQQSYVVPNSN